MALEERFRKREQKESVGNHNERWPNTDNTSRPSAERRSVGVRGFLTLLRERAAGPPGALTEPDCASRREKERETASSEHSFLSTLRIGPTIDLACPLFYDTPPLG